MKSLMESYNKKLCKSKSSRLITNIRLPKLLQNYYFHNLIKRKIEKLRICNERTRNNSGEKKVKAELPNLLCIHKIDNDYLRNNINIKNIQKKLNNKNKKNQSFDSFSYRSNYKTIISNSSNNNSYIRFSNIINNNINNNSKNDSNNNSSINNIFDNCVNNNTNINNNINNKDINNGIDDYNKDINTKINYNICINSNNVQKNNIIINKNNNYYSTFINLNNKDNTYDKNKRITIKPRNNKNSEGENNKMKSENSLFKRNYYIKRKELNRDIFNLINSEKNYIFLSKIKPPLYSGNDVSNYK